MFEANPTTTIFTTTVTVTTKTKELSTQRIKLKQKWFEDALTTNGIKEIRNYIENIVMTSEPFFFASKKIPLLQSMRREILQSKILILPFSFFFFVIFSLTAIIFFKELILIIPNIIVSGHVKKLCDNSSLLCYFITNLSIQPPKINHALKFFESPDNP